MSFHRKSMRFEFAQISYIRIEVGRFIETVLQVAHSILQDTENFVKDKHNVIDPRQNQERPFHRI